LFRPHVAKDRDIRELPPLVASERVLFVSRNGTRLSPRAADAVVRRVASAAMERTEVDC